MRLTTFAIIALFVGFATTSHATLLSRLISPNDSPTIILTDPAPIIQGYKVDKAGIESFYATWGSHSVWDLNTPEGRTAFTDFITSIDHVINYHGLNREDYPLPHVQRLLTSTDDAAKAEMEVLAIDALLRLAHSLHGDYNNLNTLYPGWSFARTPVDIPAHLATAITSGKLNDFIASLTPKAPAYTKLAEGLALYRSFAANMEGTEWSQKNWPKIEKSTGKSAALLPHDTDKRVAQIRMRLAAERYLPPTPNTSLPNVNYYDDDLAKLVKDYQLHNGLTPDGHIGTQTLAALNTPLLERIDQITANMERWRHMPDDFPPERRIIINIAAMDISIQGTAQTPYKGAVIVGRTDRHTPFIQSTIHTMIINPSWHVPTSIAQKDILPKLREDPLYLEKMDVMIKGRTEDPHGTQIDWHKISPQDFDLRLRQMPGDQNSLGHIKFNFDNPFAVYMHGTPHPELFDKAERAFSSGCIRLEDPNKVAEILTAQNKEPWLSARIEETIATDTTKTVRIANPIPIYVLYWTVFPEEDGRLAFRKDIYGYDQVLAHIMKNHPTEKMHIPLQPPEKKRYSPKKP